MQLFTFSSCFVLCMIQAVYGHHFENLFESEEQNDNNEDIPGSSVPSTSSKSSDGLSKHSSDNFEFYNISTDLGISIGSTPDSESSTADTSYFQSTEHSTTRMPNELVKSTSSNQRMETSKEIFSNETHFNSSEEYSSSSSSPVSNGGTHSGETSTISVVSSSSETNATSSTPEQESESEGVVIGKPFTPVNGTTLTSKDRTLYQRTLEIISDTYTLSIFVPVAAGVVFAITIITTIATCRCLKRRCRRRRLRRKVLPDSVKNLRPSDHARLLAESSDDEF